MKEIKLSQNLVTQIDDEDYEYLNQFKWSAFKDKNTFYAVRCFNQNGVTSFKRIHRIIMKITDSKIKIDHKDGNGLNNQKSNLRICTIGQNNSNRRPAKNKKLSIYLGVYKEYNRYTAYIRHNKKREKIGSYSSEVEAAKAYNSKALEYHKEFARLNDV
jgi:hypothetical protein